MNRPAVVQPDPALPQTKPQPFIRGIVVCVEYDDLLRITLARNLRHLQEVVVVTAPQDARTAALVAETPGAKLFVTDAFYRQGATFNKGLAMEEGFDFLGRHGWIMVWDADIVLPPRVDWSFLEQHNLYTPPRHMLYDVSKFSDDLDWKPLHVPKEYEFAGYCQIFHGEDRRLVDRRPWYGTNWPHAGGCDSDFQYIWTTNEKIRPGFNVLHLGQDTRNWCGRVTDRVDNVALPDQDKRGTMMQRIRTDPRFRVIRLPGEPIPQQ